ncbi:PREDICTED: urokinase plasminogen activator surface receptor-like isoform X1 [Poecilia mexicana]|uniref:urokinase plasminogen activator surface receptor-like isoform X1 n=1 Tax=Poecilia mexicana TaxID=48701 RepID=UPI00072E8E6C|nr:PREDICTED: urokinase plasminogen activator surface receptor-like isoform X1 [Poecilia mexicana]
MFLFTLVLQVLFLPEADNLKCECASNLPGSCTQKTIECSSQNYRCSAATQVKFLGGAKFSELNDKSCVLPELCLDFSVNYGAYRVVQKSSCCNGDICNAKIDYPKPDDKLTPSGRKCFSCVGENCMKTLDCVGDENYCVKVTGNLDGASLTMKGCASELVCSDKTASLVNQFTGVKLSCCQGDYCNSASSASPTLLLLLVPLLISTLFS